LPPAVLICFAGVLLFAIDRIFQAEITSPNKAFLFPNIKQIPDSCQVFLLNKLNFFNKAFIYIVV